MESNENVIDFGKMLTLEYDEYMKMMCSHRKKPHTINGNLCVTFGTGQIKNFLAMKRNVVEWFNDRTSEERQRILSYLSIKPT